MDARKRYIAMVAAVVAAVNAVYIWIAFPFIAAVVRYAPLAKESSHDLPIAINAIREWAAQDLFSGPFAVPDPLGWYAIPGWVLLAAMDIAFLVALLRSRKAPVRNEVLDSLPDPVSGNYYGDARFLTTAKDYARHASFEMLDVEQLKARDAGYIYLGMSDGKVCGTAEGEHVLVLAPTGVGKTQRMILHMIAVLALSDESICVFDPKGELFGLCSPFLEEMGFPVNRIDFSDPSAGNRWNPLGRAAEAYKRLGEVADQMEDIRKRMGSSPERHAEFLDLQGKYSEIVQEAEFEVSQIVGMVMPRPDRAKEGGESFWSDGAEDCLKMAFHFTACWETIPDGQRTLQTALMMLQEYATARKLYPDNPKPSEFYYPIDEMIYKLPVEHPAFQAMRALESANDDYRKSFLRTAIGVLSPFASHHSLIDMMSGTDFPADTLCDRKTATFIIAPETKREFQSFAQFYINQMYKTLMDKADKAGGKLPRRMNMIAEELGQLPNIDDFGGILSIARGKGMRWVLVLQDFARLNERYGRDVTPTIVNNCAWQVLLETNDLSTAKHFSETFGTYTTFYKEHSSSQKALSWHKDNFSESGRTTSRQLLTPAEIERWDVDYGAFVTKRGQRPAIVPVPMIHTTQFSGMLGLGDIAHNDRKVTEVRAAKTHPDHYQEPKWRPEYKDQLKYYTDEQAKARQRKWLRSMSAVARKRRGLDSDDFFGGAKKAAAKPQQAAKDEGAKAPGRQEEKMGNAKKEGAKQAKPQQAERQQAPKEQKAAEAFKRPQKPEKPQEAPAEAGSASEEGF